MAENLENTPTTKPASSTMATLYEGVSVQLVSAPFGKRLLAYVVDLGIVTCVIYGALIVLGLLMVGSAGILVLAKKMVPSAADSFAAWLPFIILMSIGLLAMFAIYDGYFIYYEFKKGMTPGKKMFGLKVVSLKNQRLTFGQCVLREVFRHVDCLLVVPGLLSVTMSKRQQRLGDMAASTLVVHSKVSESKQNYVYIGQEDYHWLIESLLPIAVPSDICRQYLTFSYPVFIMKNVTAEESDKDQWAAMARSYFSKPDGVKLDRDSTLRFFAEICFQTLNKEKN